MTGGRGTTGGCVSFRGVHHAYRDRTVIRDVSLELVERRIGIIGANGSGKSTLARMINGLVQPTAGRIHVNGLDVARHGRQVRQQVGFVFTNPDSQIVMPTVAEDVAFSLRRSGLTRAEIAERVAAMLDAIGLAGYADHPAHLLSEGQKQMMALAGVLIRRPSIVVADEPTTLLDLGNARRMTQALAALDQQLIVVTHQLEFLESFDRIILIDDGRVAGDGPPTPVLQQYRGMHS